MLPGRAGTQLKQYRRIVEIGGGVTFQIRSYQNISFSQQIQLLIGISSGHDGCELTDHGKGAPQFVGLHQAVGNIYSDDDVSAHFPGNADWQVIGDATVHQQLAITLHWRIHARNAHAGPNGLGQVALTDNHLLAGFQVSGNSTKWNRKPVKILDQCGVTRQLVEDEPEVLAGDQPSTDMQAIGANTNSRYHRKPPVILLSPNRFVDSAGVVSKAGKPVHLDKALLDVTDRHTTGIEGAHRRTGTGAYHKVNGDPHFLQHPEHAHMGHPLGASAAENQPYPGTFLSRRQWCQQKQRRGQEPGRNRCPTVAPIHSWLISARRSRRPPARDGTHREPPAGADHGPRPGHCRAAPDSIRPDAGTWEVPPRSSLPG